MKVIYKKFLNSHDEVGTVITRKELTELLDDSGYSTRRQNKVIRELRNTGEETIWPAKGNAIIITRD